MKINLSHNIKVAENILKGYWKEKPIKKFVKPKFKIVFISLKRKNSIDGFLYAYDINDGYFRNCIIDELTIKRKSDKEGIKSLLRKLIIYCKKEKIHDIICATIEKKDKIEINSFKEVGFLIEKGPIARWEEL